jgi:2-C-methyl-D-erythritol 2,4-cyclodiphosphate synthase
MQRVGMGYDSHRFTAGRPLVLGGVRIEHGQGLSGHSDADAVLHAVIDAVLGAAAAGDIGEHFPDRDEKWRNADSAMLLRATMQLVAQQGWRAVNCDVTVVAEQPRLSPYKQAMRQRIAELLGVDWAAVSVKGKTNEGMGFVGRGEGLAVLAAVLMER